MGETEVVGVEVQAKPATLKQVTDFFRSTYQTLKEFSEDWKRLTEQDKDDLKKGIGDGSFTY